MELRFDHGMIRGWRPGDIPDLVEFASHPDNHRNLGFPYPYTRSDAVAWIERVDSMEDATHWALEVEARAVGGIGFEIFEGRRSKSAELGYWVGEPFRGRGIATAAVRAVVPEAMSRYGLIRVQAHVYEWNEGSMRVLEKAGFNVEGRLRKAVVLGGEVFDDLIYGHVDQG